MNRDQRNKSLNELLRGEISAQETYQQVLEKVDEDPLQVQELRRIHQDHTEAAELLRREISKEGGSPENESGMWGGFAKAVTGTAKVFGDKAALKALKEGEEHGFKSYQRALEDEGLSQDDKQLISSRLIPLQQQHIQIIDRFMEAI
ncbi:MAG: DUF2383 domain-containing protein [Oligoflexus sp.]